ncbi:MAG: hypothetical protein WDN30_06835 [Pararobbsia sp.]
MKRLINCASLSGLARPEQLPFRVDRQLDGLRGIRRGGGRRARKSSLTARVSSGAVMMKITSSTSITTITASC